MEKGILMGRQGRPEEIASTFLFLRSELHHRAVYLRRWRLHDVVAVSPPYSRATIVDVG
ncbi:MAG: hypothetical protein ACRYFU_03685 [Janthinobacterium lividum]